MAKMQIECGTSTRSKFEIEIDDYGVRYARHLDPQDYKRAFDLLHDTMDDWSFIDDGCRNEDAINSCIALHVLGYHPAEWFENFFDRENQDSKFFDVDIEKFMDHVDRVCGEGEYDTDYLFRWGPVGHEARALGYAI